jgi:hypothetical protein
LSKISKMNQAELAKLLEAIAYRFKEINGWLDSDSYGALRYRYFQGISAICLEQCFAIADKLKTSS